MSTRVSVSLPIAAPVEAVFAAMVDLAAQDEWMLGTRLYPLAGDTPVPEVGSRLAALTGLRGLGILDLMEVTVFEPPRRWETRHTGAVIRGRGIFTVDPSRPGSCVATWVEEVDLPLGLLGRVAWPVARPAVAWGLRRSLRRLAAGVLDGTLPPPRPAPPADRARPPFRRP